MERRMKKCMMLVSLCMLVLSGCGKANTQETSKNPQIDSSLTREDTEDTQQTTEIQQNNETTKEETQYVGETYTWQEISVVIPESWQDKYVVQENETGFSIMQKASFEKNEDGYLCGFQRSDAFFNYGAGETLLAYMTDGVFYYLMQPTDVACYYEDENILAEYEEMLSDVLLCADSMRVTAGEIRYDAKEYILPQSSFMALDIDVLCNLNDNELMIAKNEIYARHGRKFKNEYLQSYFNTCSWYEGTVAPDSFKEKELSQVEKDNLNLIADMEQAYKERYPYPIAYGIDEQIMADLDGDEIAEAVSYHVKEKSDGVYEYELIINDKAFDLSGFIYIDNPVLDTFYITNLSDYDKEVEIALLDDGPSGDPETHFFYYEDELKYIGSITGFPFSDKNGGVNGFTNQSGVYGTVREDLIETAYLDGYWWYDSDVHELNYQDMRWHNYKLFQPHELYENLQVHMTMDAASPIKIIPAQKEVFFMLSDGSEWILVKGKDGTKGYLHVQDGMLPDQKKSADAVFSDLYYFE